MSTSFHTLAINDNNCKIPLNVWITINWKILKEMGIPDHITCLLRNLYAGQEATVRTRHGTDWFQIRKGMCKGCILSSCLFNLNTEYIMRNCWGWMKHKLESRLLGIIPIPQLRRWHHLYGRKQRTKEPLDESKRREWKSWLKTQHSKS